MRAESLTSLIDALPLPTIVIGPDDRVIASNEPAAAILGPDLVGRHYITALRQPTLLEAIAKARSQDEPEIARFAGRDGDKDTVYRVYVARADTDIVITFEDQTDAANIGQMRREFVANVSHELRTPLTALLGFIETLGGAARDDPEARDRFLGIMEGEASRMTRLVDDLLSLSRVEEDERVRPRDHVDLAALLASVIKGLEPQVQSSGVTVTLENNGSGELIPGDAGQLVQVFTNLIENGIKYGAAGGEVTVVLFGTEHHPRLRGDGVRVCVCDRGEGIAEHHIARLTERFYRVDNHRSRQVGGTGLGLAIVKHIVSRHRGRLAIESELGEGTKVSIFLPIDGLS